MRQFLLIIFSLVFVSLAAETNTEKVEATSQQQEEITREQEAQSLESKPKSSKEAAQAQEYILGNGDTIRVSIYGNFQAERNLIIDSRGYISFLLTGPIKASGKTIIQLREEIQAIIQKKRKHIIVSVVPLSFNSQSYTIGGQIKFPGKKVFRRC